MLSLILSRIARAVLLLFILSLLVFCLSRRMPGDVLTIARMDPSVSPETLTQLRVEYGLDRPLPVQFIRWLGQVLQGNLGYSPVEKRAIAPLLWERLGRTVALAAVTISLTLVVTLFLSLLPLGPSWNQRWLDSGMIPFLLAIPTVLTSLLLNWVRIQAGMASARYGTTSVWMDVANLLWPSLALSIPLTAYLARQLRREIFEILSTQYVTIAKSKGLQIRYLARHVLRPTAPVFLNLVGIVFTSLVGGAIVAETVFDFPGIGLLTLEAVLNRDTFLLVASILSGCALVILVNLSVDILAVWVDPRLRSKASS